MKVKDLLALLEAQNPEANVYLALGPHGPAEAPLEGVAVRADVFQAEGPVGSIAYDRPEWSARDVLLVQGGVAQPGSDAWLVTRPRRA
ncbi:MAG TPA: hypothetical protein VFS43_27895 [Polyangiaceae bacterium]|nr:hypothetical protein [Polyangiaceae bacterium]